LVQPERKASSARKELKELKATPVPQVPWGQSVQLDRKASPAHKDQRVTRELLVLLGQLV
jgi:hypothetical protein